jgi:hypothetical protein
MDEDTRQKHIQQVVQRQLSQDDMREAFRSHLKVRTHDDRFNQLLERLEQAEIEQTQR